MTDEDDAPNEPPTVHAVPPTQKLDLGWRDLMEVINADASRTTYYLATSMLKQVDLTNNEIDALMKMPATYRQAFAAELIEYAEALREGSRSLDAQLMRLTGELV